MAVLEMAVLVEQRESTEVALPITRQKRVMHAVGMLWACCGAKRVRLVSVAKAPDSSLRAAVRLVATL